MAINDSPRITPLLPSQWGQEILEALGAFPSSLNFVLNKWEEKSDDKRGQNTLGVLAHYPALAKAFLTFNKHVAIDTSLTARDKELLILRITWLAKADNEFAQHLILGRRAGLTDAEMLRVQDLPTDAGWSAEDALLVRAADELYRDNRISDTTFLGLRERYENRQIMDMLFLMGCYRMLGSVINSFNIPLDDGMDARDPLIKPFLDSRE